MEDDEFARATHTLKGLSASIGAKDLHNEVTVVDKSQNRELLADLNAALKLVIDELEEKLVVNDSDDESSDEKEELSSELRDELLERLKEALDSMEPEACELTIKTFSKYKLSQEDKDTFDKIRLLVDEYDFDKALALL